VHVCVVTSLPSASIQQYLQGRYGYHWYGDWHADNSSVGILVVSLLQPITTEVGTTLPHQSHRQVAIAVGEARVQGVYAPYVGKQGAVAHREFLRGVVENHLFLQEQSPTNESWTCGDFNLRGVAEGNGRPPKPNTAHARFSEWFRQELEQHDLNVAASEQTYVDGGTLDIHIRRRMGKLKARTYWLPKVYSDHAVSVVKTDIAVVMSQKGPAQEGTAARVEATVVNWMKGSTQWIHAVGASKNLWEATATLLSTVAVECSSANWSTEDAQCIADWSALMIHAPAVMIGHAAKLVDIGRPKQYRPKVAACRAREDHRELVLEAESEVAKAEEEAAKDPADQALVALVQVAKVWRDETLKLDASAVASRPVVQQSFRKACLDGTTAIERWLTRSVSAQSPRLELDSAAQIRKAVNHKRKVGALDPKCDKGADRRASGDMARAAEEMKRRVRAGWDPPVAVIGPDDHPSQARLFFAENHVKKMLLKRAARKESSRLPVAFFRACAGTSGTLHMITAFLDITWATGCIADVIGDIELASLYKFKGLPRTEPASYRDVGLAPGLLALISDAMHLRCGPFYAAAGADFQIGGRKDGRFHIITAWEATSHRRAFQLPTVDFLVDARFGYDGGRHGQLLMAAKHAQLRPREWLLLFRMLAKVRIHLRCRNETGTYAILDAIPQEAGGTVQGLSISGECYGALPVYAAVKVAERVPAPCTKPHPVPLEAYRVTCDNESWNGDVYIEDLVVRADVILALLATENQADRTAVHTTVRNIFQACASDAERLLLLDMTAEESGPQSQLFVDDGRFRTSCATAAAWVADGLTEYAECHGVVFPTGPKEKCVVVADHNGESSAAALSQTLHERLQGGTPTVVPKAEQLGVPVGRRIEKKAPLAVQPRMGVPQNVNRLPQCEAASRAPTAADDADLILRKVERKGALAIRTVVVRSRIDAWPLVARRYYFQRAACQVAYLAPLTVPAPTAGKRITNLQVRWAVAVMSGEVPRTCGQEVLKEHRWALLNDLGWPSLWVTTLSSAITLYQRMREDEDAYGHARAAKHPSPAAGSWVQVMRRTMHRFCIPDVEGREETESRAATKRRLKRYRYQIVTPALSKKLEEGRPRQPALPWGWIATASLPQSGFRRWWHMRCLRAWPPPVPERCPLCQSPEPPSWEHMQRCKRIRMIMATMQSTWENCFGYPADPRSFRTIVEAFETADE